MPDITACSARSPAAPTAAIAPRSRSASPRDSRPPGRRRFELSLGDDAKAVRLTRHARPRAGHPRPCKLKKKDVDGRDKPCHDGQNKAIATTVFSSVTNTRDCTNQAKTIHPFLE